MLEDVPDGYEIEPLVVKRRMIGCPDEHAIIAD